MAVEVKAATPTAESSQLPRIIFFTWTRHPIGSVSADESKSPAWLFHREGKAIHGLRGVVKPVLRSERVYKARRKRARPAIGAAYPSLPEAAMSGFLLEIEDLPTGTSHYRTAGEGSATKIGLPFIRRRSRFFRSTWLVTCGCPTSSVSWWNDCAIVLGKILRPSRAKPGNWPRSRDVSPRSRGACRRFRSRHPPFRNLEVEPVHHRNRTIGLRRISGGRIHVAELFVDGIPSAEILRPGPSRSVVAPRVL